MASASGELAVLASGQAVPGCAVRSGEVVALTTSSAQSAAAPAGATAAEIWADAAFYFAEAANPTASATTGAYPANVPRIVPLRADGNKIAARTLTGTGNLYVNWI